MLLRKRVNKNTHLFLNEHKNEIIKKKRMQYRGNINK